MPKKILIIDDEVFYRELIKDIVTAGGYEVIGEAPNGDVGIKMAKELSPDIIFIDLVMPIKDGLGTLEELMSTGLNFNIVM